MKANKKVKKSAAKFVREVTVLDPQTGGGVSISIYQHVGGALFGIDTSYITEVLDNDDGKPISIPDPFSDIDEPKIVILKD